MDTKEFLLEMYREKSKTKRHKYSCEAKVGESHGWKKRGVKIVVIMIFTTLYGGDIKNYTNKFISNIVINNQKQI